ncbi:MAG: FtsQ-type POTRA domain-containing protein [Treponema sp.]|nr:FtsQ-type POTRA domain-containing protein [Treponema sp.]
MSNYYSQADYETYQEVSEKDKSSRKIEKGLKKLLIIAAFILLAQVIWLFGVSPFVPLATIEVHGFSGLERSEILALAGIGDRASFASVNTAEIQRVLSAHVLVESAIVTRRFPDQLSIFLIPRRPAAVTLTNFGASQVPLLIDRNGVFFKIANAQDMTAGELSSLPVISGIDNPRLNTRLPDALVPLMASLGELALNSPELLSAISEIRIERKAWQGFELVLFPVHSPIRVRVENNLTENKLRYMLVMLNVFSADSQKPQEIDFRSGMASYTVRG